MKIRAKGLSAEVEIELPNEEPTINYHAEKIKSLIEKVTDSVIEIEKQLAELNKTTTP